MKLRKSLGASLVLAIVLTPGMAMADTEAPDGLDSLREVAPELAQLAAPASADTSEFGGAVAEASGDTIEITSDQGTIQLTSENTATGAEVSSVLMQDASALFAIRIENLSAPASYDFTLSIPEGAEATTLEDGGIILRDAEGEYLGGVAPPWARDADGSDVPTSLTLTGNKITQHVDFSEVSADKFPVIADPYLGKWLVESAYVTNQGGSNYVVRAVPTAYGRHASGAAILAEHTKDLKSRLGTLAYKVNSTIENQFHCHVVYNGQGGGATYDMESWRPDVWWWVQAAKGCNP
ncbi:DUF2599 domain-containing protein [Microbacterium sp. VKM Ac-2923]|uniref:DUF2599 domain-containing protein n=1 Tax=Microbacterium sp. VKM Ac-2923 TaxID=2929476 RepID=UPI001FB30556|nr:DUF2599 domain-containing protein [Microbacterium sp. VKM Ac-2923]MCJ1709543.1 DUF2599 domain-containing protein [Microbacterium sp. VKM Ac-2923]